MKIIKLYPFLLLCLFLFACSKEDSRLLYGYIEGEFIMVSSTSGGVLKSLMVHPGERVAAGTALFSIDLAELQSKQSIARADINRLSAERDNLQKEYNRALALHKAGGLSTSELDNITTRLTSIKNHLSSARQILMQISIKLKEAAPQAINTGVIQETFYKVGEYVLPGRPVVSLLTPDNIKARFFVSQQQLASINLGQSINIDCDGCSSGIPAKISYISSYAEYTPPVIYSVESRHKLVFLVEAIIDDYNQNLKPGLPVSVILDVGYE